MAGNLLAHLRFLAIWSKESGAEGDLIVVRNVAICRNLSQSVARFFAAQRLLPQHEFRFCRTESVAYGTARMVE